MMAPTFKKLFRFASLKHNIYIAADRTPVDVDLDAHACGPAMFTNHDDPPTLTRHHVKYSVYRILGLPHP